MASALSRLSVSQSLTVLPFTAVSPLSLSLYSLLLLSHLSVTHCTPFHYCLAYHSLTTYFPSPTSVSFLPLLFFSPFCLICLILGLTFSNFVTFSYWHQPISLSLLLSGINSISLFTTSYFCPLAAALFPHMIIIFFFDPLDFRYQT